MAEAAKSESFGRFSTSIDLALELAIESLPYRNRILVGAFLSERRARANFMQTALREGLCALALHAESTGGVPLGGWTFEVVKGKSTYDQFVQRVKAFDAALGALPQIEGDTV